MTATQLISALQAIIDERDGEDIDIKIDDGNKYHELVTTFCISDVLELDGADAAILATPFAYMAYEHFDAGLSCPDEVVIENN
jgi:hypothetical protein